MTSSHRENMKILRGQHPRSVLSYFSELGGSSMHLPHNRHSFQQLEVLPKSKHRSCLNKGTEVRILPNGNRKENQQFPPLIFRVLTKPEWKQVILYPEGLHYITKKQDCPWQLSSCKAEELWSQTISTNSSKATTLASLFIFYGPKPLNLSRHWVLQGGGRPFGPACYTDQHPIYTSPTRLRFTIIPLNQSYLWTCPNVFQRLW